MSFFRDRSPVTPKNTRAQGSGIRGSRRSCAVRSGLPTCAILPVFSGRAGLPTTEATAGIPGGGLRLPCVGARSALGGVARAGRSVGGRVERLLHVAQQLGPARLE